MDIFTLDKFTQGILPLVIVFLKKCNSFNDCFSEFIFKNCVKVLHTKKNKYTTKIVYVQDKILPKPQELCTGMPVMPVKNSRSDY